MLLFGGIAAAVIVVVLVVMNSSGGDQARAAGDADKSSPPPAAKVPASSSQPLSLGSASAGKTPTTAPPPFTQQDLQEFQRALDEVKKVINEAKTARTGEGDNSLARTKMGEATRLLEAAEAKVTEQLRWQEEAQMEEWAQPAEYVTFERLYSTFSKYQKEARMGGG